MNQCFTGPSSAEIHSSRPEPFGKDPFLRPYADKIAARRLMTLAKCRELCGRSSAAALARWADAGNVMGLHHLPGDLWSFRDWAPNASAAWLVGDFSGWERRDEWRLQREPGGEWSGCWSGERLAPGMNYLISFDWPGGRGERVPAWCDYAVQDPETLLFCAQIPELEEYRFRNRAPARREALLIYEAHAGMSGEAGRVTTFREFTRDVLPRIAAARYNTVQLMGVMSHPYYGSFGYHVANFYSVSSRFGTKNDLKRLVDAAHGLGLRVIMDLVHSHAVKNEAEGIARYDGTRSQFFHAGARGEHAAWDSLCFDYSRPEVLRFLLSNCRWWLEEYHLDGFRFDGVTSMLYRHHGLGKCFTGYDDYFGSDADDESYVYLTLANMVIHGFRRDAVTVAEDVSGMPGLAAPAAEGGCGFDYRMAMGVTDCWFKLFDQRDEEWSMGYLWHELTNRRADERSVSYVECHDQAIVGGQTAIFRLIGDAMYRGMRLRDRNPEAERGAALVKIAKLLTLGTAGNGYLNFMGNEFGHPEWIDFPREGNNWSYHYARRQWSLSENPELFYRCLGEFDRALLEIAGTDGVFARKPQPVKIDERRKIIAFERGGLWFLVNLHPVDSIPECAFEVPPGEYELALDSDAAKFGGCGRVAPGQIYCAMPVNGVMAVRVYLPCRTALILRRRNNIR